MKKNNKKFFKLREKEIGSKEEPLICVPLVGSTNREIMDELKIIIRKNPDLIEWRADYFSHLEDTQEVVKTLTDIRVQLKEIPLLFTIRSEKEGGQPCSLNEEMKIQLITEICATGKIDMLDYELVNDKADIHTVREISSSHGIRLILSYHNFNETPEYAQLLDKCKQGELLDADMVKIAVMANEKEDVLSLLNVTVAAEKLVKIPLITISMGEYGSISRMFGWAFGSTITFASGDKSSAPGQLPVEDLQTVIQILNKSLNTKK